MINQKNVNTHDIYRRLSKSVFLFCLMYLIFSGYFILSAVSYAKAESIKSNPEKIISWTINSAVNFRENSDPYLQYYLDSKKMSTFLDSLKKFGVNTITVTVLWKDIEGTKGVYNYEKYDTLFDLARQKDLRIIPLLVGNCGDPLSGSPDWFWNENKTIMTTDFAENEYACVDFATVNIPDDLLNFYKNTTNHFNSKYKDSIYAVGIGISEELEIKYSQHGYNWQTYSDSAQILFKNWLEKKYGSIDNLNKSWNDNYKSFDDLKIPIINYNTNGNSGLPDTNNSFSDLMQFREDLVYNFTSKLINAIRSNNDVKTIGYVSQFFTIHDAIYSSQIIDKLVDLFNIIVVDYNFYNGAEVVNHEFATSMMVNYARNLGYEKVLAGIFVERLWPLHDDQLVSNTIRNSIVSNADGIEIGNVRSCDFGNWNFLNNMHDIASKTDKAQSSALIAIYASKWNFYKWHGDTGPNNKDLWFDSLYSTYKILVGDKNYKVDVLGDNGITAGHLDKYEILYIPSQLVIPKQVMEKILEWHKKGGFLIQDWQAGSWGSFDSDQSNWTQDTFGLSKNINWSIKGGTLIDTSGLFDTPNSEKKFGLDISDKLPLQRTIAFISPKYQNYTAIFAKADNPSSKTFVISQNSVTFGFQPQLIAMYDQNKTNAAAAMQVLIKPIEMHFSKNLKLIDIQKGSSNNTISFEGKIKNSGKIPLESKVNIIIYDKDGNMTSKEQKLGVIKPEQILEFQIRFDNKETDNYTVNAKGVPVSQLSSELVSEDHVQRDDNIVQVTRHVYTENIVCNFPWFEQTLKWFNEHKVPSDEVQNAAIYLKKIHIDRMDTFNSG